MISFESITSGKQKNQDPAHCPGSQTKVGMSSLEAGPMSPASEASRLGPALPGLARPPHRAMPRALLDLEPGQSVLGLQDAGVVCSGECFLAVLADPRAACESPVEIPPSGLGLK